MDGMHTAESHPQTPHAYTRFLDKTQPNSTQPHTQVDFLQWKSDANIREVKILRRYHIQDREDYVK